MRNKLRILLLPLVAPLLVTSCATHDPKQVRIEDRSLGNRSATVTPSAPTESSAPARAYSTSPYPDSSDTGARDQAPAPVFNQPPPLVAPTSKPSGALLALLDRAEQQQRGGNNQQAIASLERAQRIAPREPLVYLQLARLRKDMNDYPRAEQLARKGLSLSSGNAEMQRAFNSLLKQLRR